MKIQFLVICFLAVAFQSLAQAPAANPFIKENYNKFEYQIPMRDGIKLFTAVYVPKDISAEKKYPILMQRTPYSCQPYGADQFPRRRFGPSEFIMKDKYVIVYQDVRGRWMSEGVFQEMTPQIPNKKSKTDVDESTDTYDTVDWLIKNIPNNNGKVGQWGISYPGFYASVGALSGHPALVASSPQAPMADLWRDDSYHNGAFLIPHNFNFYPYFTNRTDGTPTKTPSGKEFKYGTEDGYEFFLNLGPMKNSQKTGLYEGKDPYWNGNLAHPNYDQFWQSRNILPHLKGIKHAVMIVGGWYDAEDLHGIFKTYGAIEKQNPGIYNILVAGPWTHGGWNDTGDQLGSVNFGEKTGPYFQENIERKFFAYFLKGEGDAKFPEAQLFETGTNKWRSFDAWPPKAAVEKNLYLLPNGKLSFDAPTASTGFAEFVSDPKKPVPFTETISLDMNRDYMVEDQRFAARRPDVLVFQTEVLDKDVTLAGNILANLKVSTTGTDADWMVKLIDVYPGDAKDNANTAKNEKMSGFQQMIRHDAFRGKFRDDKTNPKPFKPGEVTNVNYELIDILHTFKKGHRIMVQVQSTMFPLYDRNPQKFVPNIHNASESDYQKATHRVYGGSLLKVRVMD
ncbi:CocE/NonD family hydrolase [Larkinella rosea]|uniref:CocE/NonD family hydrolase n=1 Tax=Larkinella rosea TaxID=2025312 RepID=A0A3P1C157_9BACT|nr:CocE/NonD family hydrolase [Larkinella rosea]RRB06803.1 CocE/NonD family hydrolase [Larkinella rosea]